MAADGGSVIWLGRPLTSHGKRMAGSSKMAADGGNVILGGQPLTEVGNRGRSTTEKKRRMLEMWLLMTTIVSRNCPSKD